MGPTGSRRSTDRLRIEHNGRPLTLSAPPVAVRLLERYGAGSLRAVPDVSETFRDPSAPIPFRDLPTGQWARLCESVSDRLVGRRLRDLGFVPGTRVLIVRRAPLGDPIEVEIRGYRICLRGGQIEGLWVAPESDGERP